MCTMTGQFMCCLQLLDNHRHEDDDWYEVFGTDSYIKTSTCLSLALGEEAYLTMSASGFGQLRFEDGDDCMVEGVYTKLRL